MQVVIIALSVSMGVVAAALIAANVYVIIATKRRHRREAMRFLAPFAQAVMFLRPSDSVTPSKPYRPMVRNEGMGG